MLLEEEGLVERLLRPYIPGIVKADIVENKGPTWQKFLKPGIILDEVNDP
jgi:hypothetical protein